MLCIEDDNYFWDAHTISCQAHVSMKANNDNNQAAFTVSMVSRAIFVYYVSPIVSPGVLLPFEHSLTAKNYKTQEICKNKCVIE